jgi:hypothetical protein
MKKLSSILFVLLACSVAMAGQLKPYAFPFIGRWQPSDPGILIDDYGFQDIRNLRKDGKNLRGVSGHTKINTAAISGYTNILNGFHYEKDQPEETHQLVYAVNSTGESRGLSEHDRNTGSGGFLHSGPIQPRRARKVFGRPPGYAHRLRRRTVVYMGWRLPQDRRLHHIFAVNHHRDNERQRLF